MAISKTLSTILVSLVVSDCMSRFATAREQEEIVAFNEQEEKFVSILQDVLKDSKLSTVMKNSAENEEADFAAILENVKAFEVLSPLFQNGPKAKERSKSFMAKFFNPFEIIAHIITGIIAAITWPVRIPYRLITTLIATVGLLLMGCRIIPSLDCPDLIFGQVEEFMTSFKEELEFYIGLANNSNK